MKSRSFTLELLLILFIVGCSPAAPVDLPTPTATVPANTATAAPSPTLSPTETPAPTFRVDATMWVSEPYAPVLIFHQFVPDELLKPEKKSTEHKIRLSDFERGLKELNAAGFTLVPAQDWLNGRLTLPPGRRPIIFTMDDLFFRDQILLREDGTPDPITGIGLLWDFYQKNPQFGFSVALFANLGDKLYPRGDTPNWKMELADVLVWGIEHHAIPYNHSYNHALLSDLEDADVKFELRMNDLFLRELLTRAGREDLVPQISNYLALPFGVWPQAKNTAILYKNPEDIQMEAIFEADYHAANLNLSSEELFMPPPYSDKFDTYHIPRLTAIPDVITALAARKDEIPTAQNCTLGPVYNEADLSNPELLPDLIRDAVTTARCPQGIYYVNGFTFRATAEKVELVLTANQQRWLPPIKD
jgi:hypothetical protein